MENISRTCARTRARTSIDPLTVLPGAPPCTSAYIHSKRVSAFTPASLHSEYALPFDWAPTTVTPWRVSITHACARNPIGSLIILSGTSPHTPISIHSKHISAFTLASLYSVRTHAHAPPLTPSLFPLALHHTLPPIQNTFLHLLSQRSIQYARMRTHLH